MESVSVDRCKSLCLLRNHHVPGNGGKSNEAEKGAEAVFSKEFRTVMMSQVDPLSHIGKLSSFWNPSGSALPVVCQDREPSEWKASDRPWPGSGRRGRSVRENHSENYSEKHSENYSEEECRLANVFPGIGEETSSLGRGSCAVVRDGRTGSSSSSKGRLLCAARAQANVNVSGSAKRKAAARKSSTMRMAGPQAVDRDKVSCRSNFSAKRVAASNGDERRKQAVHWKDNRVNYDSREEGAQAEGEEEEEWLLSFPSNPEEEEEEEEVGANAVHCQRQMPCYQGHNLLEQRRRCAVKQQTTMRNQQAKERRPWNGDATESPLSCQKTESRSDAADVHFSDDDVRARDTNQAADGSIDWLRSVPDQNRSFASTRGVRKGGGGGEHDGVRHAKTTLKVGYGTSFVGKKHMVRSPVSADGIINKRNMSGLDGGGESESGLIHDAEHWIGDQWTASESSDEELREIGGRRTNQQRPSPLSAHRPGRCKDGRKHAPPLTPPRKHEYVHGGVSNGGARQSSDHADSHSHSGFHSNPARRFDGSANPRHQYHGKGNQMRSLESSDMRRREVAVAHSGCVESGENDEAGQMSWERNRRETEGIDGKNHGGSVKDQHTPAYLCKTGVPNNLGQDGLEPEEDVAEDDTFHDGRGGGEWRGRGPDRVSASVSSLGDRIGTRDSSASIPTKRAGKQQCIGQKIFQVQGRSRGRGSQRHVEKGMLVREEIVSRSNGLRQTSSTGKRQTPQQPGGRPRKGVPSLGLGLEGSGLKSSPPDGFISEPGFEPFGAVLPTRENVRRRSSAVVKGDEGSWVWNYSQRSHEDLRCGLSGPAYSDEETEVFASDKDSAGGDVTPKLSAEQIWSRQQIGNQDQRAKMGRESRMGAKSKGGGGSTRRKPAFGQYDKEYNSGTTRHADMTRQPLNCHRPGFENSECDASEGSAGIWEDDEEYDLQTVSAETGSRFRHQTLPSYEVCGAHDMALHKQKRRKVSKSSQQTGKLPGRRQTDSMTKGFSSAQGESSEDMDELQSNGSDGPGGGAAVKGLYRGRLSQKGQQRKSLSKQTKGCADMEREARQVEDNAGGDVSSGGRCTGHIPRMKMEGSAQKRKPLGDGGWERQCGDETKDDSEGYDEEMQAMTAEEGDVTSNEQVQPSDRDRESNRWEATRGLCRSQRRTLLDTSEAGCGSGECGGGQLEYGNEANEEIENDCATDWDRLSSEWGQCRSPHTRLKTNFQRGHEIQGEKLEKGSINQKSMYVKSAAGQSEHSDEADEDSENACVTGCNRSSNRWRRRRSLKSKSWGGHEIQEGKPLGSRNPIGLVESADDCMKGRGRGRTNDEADGAQASGGDRRRHTQRGEAPSSLVRVRYPLGGCGNEIEEVKPLGNQEVIAVESVDEHLMGSDKARDKAADDLANGRGCGRQKTSSLSSHEVREKSVCDSVRQQRAGYLVSQQPVCADSAMERTGDRGEADEEAEHAVANGRGCHVYLHNEKGPSSSCDLREKTSKGSCSPGSPKVKLEDNSVFETRRGESSGSQKLVCRDTVTERTADREAAEDEADDAVAHGRGFRSTYLHKETTPSSSCDALEKAPLAASCSPENHMVKPVGDSVFENCREECLGGQKRICAGSLMEPTEEKSEADDKADDAVGDGRSCHGYLQHKQKSLSSSCEVWEEMRQRSGNRESSKAKSGGSSQPICVDSEKESTRCRDSEKESTVDKCQADDEPVDAVEDGRRFHFRNLRKQKTPLPPWQAWEQTSRASCSHESESAKAKPGSNQQPICVDLEKESTRCRDSERESTVDKCQADDEPVDAVEDGRRSHFSNLHTQKSPSPPPPCQVSEKTSRASCSRESESPMAKPGSNQHPICVESERESARGRDSEKEESAKGRTQTDGEDDAAVVELRSGHKLKKRKQLSRSTAVDANDCGVDSGSQPRHQTGSVQLGKSSKKSRKNMVSLKHGLSHYQLTTGAGQATNKRTKEVWLSLHSAVDNALPGDVILLRGRFEITRPLIINKSVEFSICYV
ncbi:hypothetical protein CBR_g23041 [Chara braunii]|uniref:Uncharacterized protein n=1 Tax=Chara braunii TaxID=69332 RepID=A0A388L3D9_CHABU|nr:hypothetical protein CBR_g23041 [Chara braunii]|eukprot:GBG76825.1 hypothetical protein CBR_g23041 [Chara braunii]